MVLVKMVEIVVVNVNLKLLEEVECSSRVVSED